MPVYPILVAFALGAALLLPSTTARAQVEVSQIGRSKVELPLPQGFSPACQESQQFSAGIAAMTPPDSRLVTCWVESVTWESVKAGRQQSAYPAMFVTHAEKLGDNWSQSEFEKLKALAQQQLPSLLGAPDGGADQVRRQNDALAKEGIAISAELLRRRYVGIFDLRASSFSYLVFREAKVKANGTPAQLQETVAITTVLHKGSVIALTTVEQNMTEQSAVAARRRSIAWLEQFTAANRQ